MGAHGTITYTHTERMQQLGLLKFRKNHEIEKKAPAQPELSSRSDFRACFVVVVRISFDPVTSTILEQDLREF